MAVPPAGIPSPSLAYLRFAQAVYGGECLNGITAVRETNA